MGWVLMSERDVRHLLSASSEPPRTQRTLSMNASPCIFSALAVALMANRLQLLTGKLLTAGTVLLGSALAAIALLSEHPSSRASPDYGNAATLTRQLMHSLR